MTGFTASTVRSYREAVQFAGAVMVILGGIISAVVWMTGGFTPQQQVQVQQLSGKVDQLSAHIELLAKKMDEMPRPGDYDTIDKHLTRLDQQVGAIGDRITTDENSFNYVKGALQDVVRGTQTPVRQPR